MKKLSFFFAVFFALIPTYSTAQETRSDRPLDLVDGIGVTYGFLDGFGLEATKKILPFINARGRLSYGKYSYYTSLLGSTGSEHRSYRGNLDSLKTAGLLFDLHPPVVPLRATVGFMYVDYKSNIRRKFPNDNNAPHDYVGTIDSAGLAPYVGIGYGDTTSLGLAAVRFSFSIGAAKIPSHKVALKCSSNNGCAQDAANSEAKTLEKNLKQDLKWLPMISLGIGIPF